MKLSIATFKIICWFWNYPQEVLEDSEYLYKTIEQLDIVDTSFSKEEQETAKKEIKELIKLL